MVRDWVRLVCRDHGGGGPSALLLHGLTGHASEWDATTRWLRDRYRVVAPDQRGHGASQRHPPEVSRAAYVADAVAVITELALGPVVLVGQSLGGHTAMLTTAARPDLVPALVLVEASPGGPDPAAPARVGRWLDTWPVPFASREAAAAFFGGGPKGWAWAASLKEHAATTLVEVPDAGHDLHLERPGALQDAMTAFPDALHRTSSRSV